MSLWNVAVISILQLLLFTNNVNSQISSSFASDNSVLFPGGAHAARLSYASTNDGKFYIFAGSSGNFRWDPSSPTLLTTLQATTIISHCWSQCAAYMPNKKIYIMGQEASNYGVIEIFDTETEEFIDHNITIPIPLRVGCTAGDYENGLIYYYGGQNESHVTTEKIFTTLQVFNISTQQWTQLASNIAATVPFISNTCIYTPNGYFFTFGGKTDWDTGAAINDVYRYDIKDDSWAKLQSNPLPYNTINARSIYNKGDDKVYIIGGIDSTYLNGVTQFNPNSNSMVSQPTLATAVDTCAVNIIGDIIRVWGGRYDGENGLSNTQFAMIATAQPSTSPTSNPTLEPTTYAPTTAYPTSVAPTTSPNTLAPTHKPTDAETNIPTLSPVDSAPTAAPQDEGQGKVDSSGGLLNSDNMLLVIVCAVCFCLLIIFIFVCVSRRRKAKQNGNDDTVQITVIPKVNFEEKNDDNVENDLLDDDGDESMHDDQNQTEGQQTSKNVDNSDDEMYQEVPATRTGDM